MFENIIELVGEKNGPTSIVLAGVHGDEKCGMEAFKKILSRLRIERGRVLFGYGNPRAIETNKRFTEANLNRMFKDDDLLSKNDKESYEYTRAQFLKKYLDQADVLLDIHASYTPGSKPFIICESNANNIAKCLPFDLVVSGFDKLEPGGTDYYMNSTGKIGICAECGYLGDPRSTRTAEKSINAFLKARGHIAGSTHIYSQSSIQMRTIYITKTGCFQLSKEFFDFEEIAIGQIIGTDDDQSVVADWDGVIVFARNQQKIGEEAFLLGAYNKKQA